MGHHRGRTMALTLVAGLALTGCGSRTTAPPSNEIHSVNGGRQLTVPALWADAARGLSGIEPAGIWAGTLGPPGFGLDLASIEAQGAGPAWKAATASAAATASMFSGLNPADIDISFTITGPIDGPSAGAILTVGTLAALRGDSLIPGVTMTGTISPDGSIGEVGGVDLKLKAAKDAGYRTVLIPTGNALLGNAETGAAEDAREVGKRLGVTVKPVANIDLAYRELTGHDLVPPTPAHYELPSTVLAAGADATKQLLGRVSAVVPSLGRDARSSIAEELARARHAAKAGNMATAYGLGADALLRAASLRGEQDVTSAIRRGGPKAAVSELRARASAAITRATGDLELSAASSWASFEQQMVLPAAMTWPAIALASLRALSPHLAASLDTAALMAAGRTVSVQEACLDALGPEALSVVRAMPGKPPLPEGSARDFLSQYSNFLIRAGKANRAYLQDVLLHGQDLSGATASAAPGSSLPVLTELDRMSSEIPVTTNSLPEEFVQAAIALAYYATSAEVVSANQNADSANHTAGATVSAAPAPNAVNDSLPAADALVTGIADYVASKGLDAGYPLWSAMWASVMNSSLHDSRRDVFGAALALDESWYDSIALLMVNAGRQVH